MNQPQAKTHREGSTLVSDFMSHVGETVPVSGQQRRQKAEQDFSLFKYLLIRWSAGINRTKITHSLTGVLHILQIIHFRLYLHVTVLLY